MIERDQIRRELRDIRYYYSKKNMFDAYVNVGFTEDQALALMINDNIQLMKNIQKSVNNTSAKKSK